MAAGVEVASGQHVLGLEHRHEFVPRKVLFWGRQLEHRIVIVVQLTIGIFQEVDPVDLLKAARVRTVIASTSLDEVVQAL
jgi:hypothetical protein